MFSSTLQLLPDCRIFKKYCQITDSPLSFEHYCDWKEVIHSKNNQFNEDIVNFAEYDGYKAFCEERQKAINIESFLQCMIDLDSKYLTSTETESQENTGLHITSDGVKFSIPLPAETEATVISAKDIMDEKLKNNAESLNQLCEIRKTVKDKLFLD